MIGIKFLVTFFTAAAYIAIGLFLALLFLFVVSYALRFFFSGLSWGISDHWKWFRGLFPGRKKSGEEWVILDPKDNFTKIGYTTNPDYWRGKGYIVLDKDIKERVE